MVSPTNKLPTPKSQQTYQRIIEAAIDCFFEAGFHASNMSSIAARAGVSRGRVQYYFATTEQLLMDAANALLMRLWGRYLGEVDRFMALRNDRDHIVWMELVAASRTDPVLRRVIKRAQKELERHALIAQDRVVGEGEGGEDKARAVSDLVRLLLEALTLTPMAEDRERRIAGVLGLVKEMLRGVW
jgi:AcrR family transcriptional regulator